MALRLYRTTRQLYGQVTRALQTLHVRSAVGANPTLFGLVALYVTGLVLLDARPSQTRISQVLPAREHDALNRLLRTVPLSTRALLAGPLRLAAGLSRALDTPGYLVVDDVVLEKPFAKRLPWAAWTYSFAQKRKVYGCHIVLLSWTSDPTGRWRIPVAFRLWRPKRTCRPGHYQQKTELVVAMLRELVAAGCPAAYLVGDTAYTGGCVSKAAGRLGLTWVGTLSPRTTVVYRGKRQAVRDLASRLKPGAVGRAQKRARELRVPGDQCPDHRPDHARAAQAEPLAHRDHFSRHQTTGRAGCLPVLGGSSAGPTCRARLPDLRRAAALTPRSTRNRGCGQGPLAGRGAARRPGSTSALARHSTRVPA